MTDKTRISWPDSTHKRSRFGPAPKPGRDGDREQARQRVNMLVKTGRMAHPNTLPCADCGHVWSDGERRHEYDHHKGYAAEHQYAVEPVCTLCHAQRDNHRAQQTHCLRGHEFTDANTYRPPSGGRSCRACMREWDRKRGPRGSDFWREVNAKRKGKNYGK